jgi:uncharacterized protein (UPF0147 family)
MIFEKIVNDLSVPKNKKSLEDKLALYYKEKKNPAAARVSATVSLTLYNMPGKYMIALLIE